MDVAALIDAELAEGIAASMAGNFDFGTIELSALPGLRVAMEWARPPFTALPAGVTRSNELVPGWDGGPGVGVRVWHNANATGAAMVWIHGGGYLFGSASMDDARLAAWADALGATIVSVEYRLAPEDPFPAALDDCYAALTWLVANAADLGVDLARVAVGGASAGGGLAAGLALLARDRGEIDLAYQLLIYPMVDDRNVTPSSRLDTLIWTRAANLLAWRAYLGEAAGTAGPPAYAAAARADDLSGLPPAFVGVGSLDIFRDEDIEYAQRLLAAGVPTELHVYPGATHGFDTMCPGAAVARRCVRDVDDALARALRG